MDKNNCNKYETVFKIDMDIFSFKGEQKTQLLEMSILPLSRIS